MTPSGKRDLEEEDWPRSSVVVVEGPEPGVVVVQERAQWAFCQDRGPEPEGRHLMRVAGVGWTVVLGVQKWKSVVGWLHD